MRVLKSISIFPSPPSSIRLGSDEENHPSTASPKLDDAGEALKEVKVLRSLSHPNVIGYYDAFCTDSCLYIVMEYANDGDLGAAIARRRDENQQYHEPEAMAIFAQVACALRHVHGCRILHRDLKSPNIFLTKDGVVKLGDFGISKILTAFESHALTWVGTPLCVPPEVCDNSPYDFKADIWGLGVVFYEILALECPFKASNLPALALKICTTEPRPVSPVYSGEVRQLLCKLLAKQPVNRPSSEEIVQMASVRRAIRMNAGSAESRLLTKLRPDPKPRSTLAAAIADGAVMETSTGIRDSFDLFSPCKSFSSPLLKVASAGVAQCMSPGSPSCGASPGSISELISFFLEGSDEFASSRASLGVTDVAPSTPYRTRTSPPAESPITSLLGELEQDFGLV
jgi:serine/threonine protein kinase